MAWTVSGALREKFAWGRPYQHFAGVFLCGAAAGELVAVANDAPLQAGVVVGLAGAALWTAIAAGRPTREPVPIPVVSSAPSGFAAEHPATTTSEFSRRDDQSLDILAARLSHDLRTPLNAVIGFSEIMQAEIYGPHADERYRDYASIIRRSGEELRRSADDMIALAQTSATRQRDEVNQEATSLHDVLAAAGDQLDLCVAHDATVVLEPLDIPKHQALIALEGIARALKAHGGEATSLFVVAAQKGNVVRLRIQNDGDVLDEAQWLDCHRHSYPDVSACATLCSVSSMLAPYGVGMRLQLDESCAGLSAVELELPTAPQKSLPLFHDSAHANGAELH